MARPEINGAYLNICTDIIICEELEKMREAARRTKTTAAESGLASYLQDYEKTQVKLGALKTNKKG
ncbi:MAG: hypothetical protein IJ109_08450 [Firmicutes bacterium]|nr:hypothetical protein [Bacillota bacterium]